MGATALTAVLFSLNFWGDSSDNTGAMNISFDPSSPKVAPVKMLAVPPSAALVEFQVTSVGDALRANFTTSLLKRLQEAKVKAQAAPPEPVREPVVTRAKELASAPEYPSAAVMRAVVRQVLA